MKKALEPETAGCTIDAMAARKRKRESWFNRWHRDRFDRTAHLLQPDFIESRRMMVNSAAASRRNTNVLSFATGACIVYYIFLTVSCPGDFQGDSWDYLSVAALIKTGAFTSYNSLRGIVYPCLLLATWRTGGSFTYFVQVALFLGSLYAALRVLAFGSVYCLVPVFAAMIPAVAFLQRQIYPDGLLVSLTLLFFIALARKLWGTCVTIGVLLALTKLVFVVTLPVALAVYALRRQILRPRVILAGLMVVPVFVALFNYLFVDLGYMVVFARPHFHGYGVERVFPDPELRVNCGGREYSIARKDLFWDPVTVPYAIAAYGPLTQEQANRLGCTNDDLRRMKRHLLARAFVDDPLLHIRLAARAFLISLVGSYELAHVSYILHLRQQSWLAHFDEFSYFEPNEVKLLERYKKNGFEIRQNQPLIFTLNAFSSRIGERVVRFAALGMLGLCAIVGYRRSRLRDCLRDPVNVSMISFLIVYSFALSVSIHTIYDRYTYVNLLILCILASRVAAMLFDPGIPERLRLLRS